MILQMLKCTEPDTVPLYPGAPLSIKASWLSIYQYAASNRLTDHATQQLLDLMRIHCPEPNSCPPSLHKLKKELGSNDDIISLYYCSNCLKNITTSGVCSGRGCKRMKSQVCYFSILPFEKRLHDIFSGI